MRHGMFYKNYVQKHYEPSVFVSIYLTARYTYLFLPSNGHMIQSGAEHQLKTFERSFNE
jgi:hypothetical protein